MSLTKIPLKHPIDVNGVSVKEIHIRHTLRMGDIAAVGRYARKHGYSLNDIESLLSSGDIGASLVLLDSICQLPEGTCEQLHPDDFAAAMEALTPFLSLSPADGKVSSVTLPLNAAGDTKK